MEAAQAQGTAAAAVQGTGARICWGTRLAQAIGAQGG